jgi:hypothetical protein
MVQLLKPDPDPTWHFEAGQASDAIPFDIKNTDPTSPGSISEQNKTKPGDLHSISDNPQRGGVSRL